MVSGYPEYPLNISDGRISFWNAPQHNSISKFINFSSSSCDHLDNINDLGQLGNWSLSPRPSSDVQQDYRGRIPEAALSTDPGRFTYGSFSSDSTAYPLFEFPVGGLLSISHPTPIDSGSISESSPQTEKLDSTPSSRTPNSSANATPPRPKR